MGAYLFYLHLTYKLVRQAAREWPPHMDASVYHPAPNSYAWWIAYKCEDSPAHPPHFFLRSNHRPYDYGSDVKFRYYCD